MKQHVLEDNSVAGAGDSGDGANKARIAPDTSGDAWERAAFARRLAAWFAGAQRDLPWREAANARDPYRVLVSEVMLQQTTVTATVPFYKRFLARFPTIQSLAAAPFEEVLALWAGLGYYQRARSLHACAKAVVEQHGGVFPRDFDEVLALPGIGRYTAGAVTSIAFDASAPIVDANVARVFARIFCLEGDLKSPVVQRRLWQEAERLVATCRVAQVRPSQFNPALMELGALICVPRAPRCQACPVADFCAAHAAGRQNELPRPTVKPDITVLHDVCFAALRRNNAGEDEILLRQRPHEGKLWWRGMWELPRTTIAAGEQPQEALARLLRDEVGLESRIVAPLHTLRHGVTHHAITLDCWAVEARGEPRAGCWLRWNDLDALAVPSTMRRLLHWLRQRQSAGQLSLL